MIALLLITSKWFFLTICLSVFLGAHGCGQLPAGQEKTTNFTVTDFKLPAIMAYSEDPTDKTRVSTISSTQNEAETFIGRLIMQSVEDVLYQQGRSAFLPDSVISLIFQQLKVQINYEPLKCDRVVTDPTMDVNFGTASVFIIRFRPSIAERSASAFIRRDYIHNEMVEINVNKTKIELIETKLEDNNIKHRIFYILVDMKMNCITTDSTIVYICDKVQAMCVFPAMAMNYKPVPPMHLSISGSLKTSNAIMANWSNQMWESILNRILRRMTSSQYGSHFFGASVRLT